MLEKELFGIVTIIRFLPEYSILISRSPLQLSGAAPSNLFPYRPWMQRAVLVGASSCVRVLQQLLSRFMHSRKNSSAEIETDHL